MAGYHDRRDGQYGAPQNGAPPGGYRRDARDAAYNDIFGAALPPNRSQTFTSASQQALGQLQLQDDDRTQTMSSVGSDAPLMAQRRRPPQQDPYATDGSNSSSRNPQGDWGPAGGGGGGGGGGPGQHQQQQQHQHQQYQQQPRAGPYTNTNYAPRAASAGYQQQGQPQPQPQPNRYANIPPSQPGPQWRPYGPLPNRGMAGMASRPDPYQRGLPGGPGAAGAYYTDPNRSQSLASMPRPQMYSQQPQARAYPPQAGPAGYAYPSNAAARTTAQGRPIPERHEDRSMSMTGYTPASFDNNHTINSGRVIPNRRPNETMSSNYGGLPQGGVLSDSAAAGYGPQAVSNMRTASMTSSTSGNDNGRTMSMASTIAPTMSDDSATLYHRPSTRSIDSERPPTAKIRPPVVYPALLSGVAVYFRRKIGASTGDRVKNELTYHHAFSGAEAVDILSYIIRTTDRNLALLLGRALDAQKFFHDVTYEHRLRDSPNEMYQFRENAGDDDEINPPVNGVFILLSECYSPTCTRDQLCYSIACPRRLEQVARLNLKPQPGLSKTETAIGEDDADQTDEQKLWVNTVPKEVAESVSDKEKKRQEVISEIFYTERDFVKDLEYLREFWITPLRSNKGPIPAQRREKVVKTIFSNIIDPPSILAVSSRFAKSLTERQQKEPIVKNIGDIFLEFVPQFEPFIHYGSKQLEAKSEFERERAENPWFSKFVDEIERRKESRKLELNGYLTKPTTRLARYPLLLENVVKYTEDGNPDKEDLPKVLVMIRDILSRVNAESGKAENRFNLRKLHEQLRFRPNERMDLRLTDEGRELIFKQALKKTPTDPTEITAFLFDHAVLLVRIKQQGKNEEVKAFRRPIPLELLSIPQMEEVIPEAGTVKRTSSSLLPGMRANTDSKKNSNDHPITFRHLGKNGFELTLYANSQPSRKKWLEHVDTAQNRVRSRADFFNTTIISAGYFVSPNRINCAVPFDGGRRLLYGTDNGLYVSDRKAGDRQPRKVLDATNVTQIDILEEYQLLLVLANKSLLSYPLSTLEQSDGSMSGRPKKIQNHCSYFRTGICMGRHLVCCLKPHAMSTTIKVFEPNEAMINSKKKQGIGRFISAGQDELKPFKEFYIPTESSSVHFLKSKLCVACVRGFEVVSLETLEIQSLLDQADTSLDFVARKEGVKPIHIERLNGEFLLNYSEFSFFVNRNGWRARPEWRIDWEGSPQNFALSYPWILAFETNFIELRSIESGAVHIVPHNNTRLLHSSTHEILFAYEDEDGKDIVASIDFWTKNNRRSEFPATPSPGQAVGAFAPPGASTQTDYLSAGLR